MSDSSRGRVTITLGRRGQVVKRDQSAADVSFPAFPPAGTKRSVRDRIGNDADSSMWHGNQPNNNKRQRGDMSLRNGVNGNGRIGKDDLRLKLMRKSASRRADSGKRHVDLREKLSKSVQPSVASINSKQRLPESRETSMLGRIPSNRSSSDLSRIESMRSSYSPWTLDHIRRRSPEGFPSTSRGISPQTNREDLQRRPSDRTYDGIRSAPYVNRDVLDTSRPSSTAPSSFVAHPTMSTLPPVTAKPVTPHPGQLPPPSSVAPRTPYVSNEQQTQTVDGLLHALGLGKYAILFKAEEVDMTALKQMGENDLKELGIPMGPRKKILLALLPRAKRHP
ncbi:SEC23-interacting protein [Senna tora]|uniref:SEC23-interacting protein n=1 Tax=Senna tora TaxID=362788 RepID=A0A834SRU9_9FABA|nr:SEC23-interacting protein [Senna tora]